jgi:DnaK suppressor protein
MSERKPLNVDRYRTQLEETRGQIEADLESYRRRVLELEGGPDEPGSGDHWERSGYGDHLADDATEVFEKEKSLGMEMTLTEHRRQVDHALSRIQDGTYGTCESCGKPIAVARLNALPEATLCIACKSRDECATADQPYAPGARS